MTTTLRSLAIPLIVALVLVLSLVASAPQARTVARAPGAPPALAAVCPPLVLPC